MPDADESLQIADRTSVLLAEFTSLRSEIAARSAAQTTLINIDLTVCGAIAGLALSQRIAVTVLLLIPFLSGCCAMLYLDHAAQIDNIASYIDTDIRASLTQLLGDEKLLAWESANRDKRTHRTPLLIRFGIPMLFLFVVGPLALCVGLTAVLGTWWEWTALIAALIVQAIVCAMWLSLFRRWSAP
ncbi:hypothetical protein [Amycolatopsis magusensis]|uniref:hypothetical protein n=1 Tax=Amycolatopsis magusensis TaxID=882444 RepID=UPI0037BA6B9B